MVSKAATKKSKGNKQNPSKEEGGKDFNSEISGELYVACIRDALTRLRIARNVTQSKLAEKLSLTQSIISRVETGETELSLAMFYNWCIALNSKPEDVARAAHAIALFKHQDQSISVAVLKDWICLPAGYDDRPEDLLNEALTK
jgi:transcriptional regulator with XRE-family HTH domain